MTKYTYRDIITKKIRYTTGKFIGWTEPTGLLSVKYAVFRRQKTDLIVPEYLLTPETKELINEIPGCE